MRNLLIFIWVVVIALLLVAAGFFLLPSGAAPLPIEPGTTLPAENPEIQSSPLPSNLITGTPITTESAEILSEQISLTPAETSTPYLTPISGAISEGPIVIGYSVLGLPLQVYRFGNGERAYMVVAGIHGGYEVNTMVLADQLISNFIQHPSQIPSDVTLFILRSMNPDGATLPYEADGRPNNNFVDLNRNFPVDWAPDWPRAGCWAFRETTSGPYPASEPETIAVMSFILENPVIALISYHASAPGFYPSGDPPHQESVDLSNLLSEASGYPYPSVDTGCYMTGSLVDWVYTTGAAAVDIELSNHYDPEIEVNLNLVKAFIQWQP